MNSQTDQQLLRDYFERRSEAAFAELVQRHVDFVYSAALRMVGDAHLAEDVTQGVFLALAQTGRKLADRPVLSGWLHRTAQNLAANAVRSEVRRRAREQEAAAMNKLLSHESDAAWERIAPHLDAALGELSEADRDALLLRYFERKSAREMAQTLGTSEDAAQKRVSRAVERLREFFAKRGVTVGASGLVALISANAVQAAPVGLAVTISTAAALAATSAATTATASATTAIAMTTLQKTIISAALVAAFGTGVYEARQSSKSQAQVETLQQRQTALTEQIDQLTGERNGLTDRLAVMQSENERLTQGYSEIPQLRAEVARLQTLQQQLAQSKAVAPVANDPFTRSILSLTTRAGELNQYLERMPEKKIPELRFLTENDWLDAARDANLQSDAGIRTALSKLRSLAKNRFAMLAIHALDKYIQENNGQLPDEPTQLKSYFEVPVDETILQRYRMLHTGNVKDLPKDTTWVISEKAPVDRDYDSHLYVGPHGRSGSWGTGKDATGDPDETWATR